MLVEQRQRRLHADEDTQEERGHFEDRPIREAVARANLTRAEGQRQGHERQHHRLTEKHPRVPVRARHGLGRVEQRHRGNDAGHQQGVGPEAADLQWAGRAGVLLDVAGAFVGMRVERVPEPVDCQQQAVGDEPRLPERQGPEEVDPLEITEKQWRIADRQQAAAAVADQKDEEHDRVGHDPPLSVGLQKRPHQQHGGTGRADETGGEGTDTEKRGVDGGRGLEVALDPHTAGDAIEREEEHDERHVFRQHRVGEDGAGHAPRWTGGGRPDDAVRREVEVDRMPVHEGVVAQCDHCQPAGHQQFAGVVLPPVREVRRERQDRDGRKQEREGQHRERRRRGADATRVAGSRRMGCVVGGRIVGGVWGRLCLHQQITTMLRPAEGGRSGVGHQKGGDPGKRSGRRRRGGG